MLRNSEQYPEGRVMRLFRDNPGKLIDGAELVTTDLRAILRELVATRVHLALVANENGSDPEQARSLARAFLNERFPGGF